MFGGDGRSQSAIDGGAQESTNIGSEPEGNKRQKPAKNPLVGQQTCLTREVGDEGWSAGRVLKMQLCLHHKMLC